MKLIRCHDCGYENIPGTVYCKKCSGDIYKQQLQEKVYDLFYIF